MEPSKLMIVIEPQGGVTVTPYHNTEPSLADLQKAVGGYIEVLPHMNTYRGQPCTAYVNEDGRRLNLDFNPVASELWAEAHGVDWRTNSRAQILGNIVIVQDLRAASEGGHRSPDMI